jgi:hypothetical protein
MKTVLFQKQGINEAVCHLLLFPDVHVVWVLEMSVAGTSRERLEEARWRVRSSQYGAARYVVG